MKKLLSNTNIPDNMKKNLDELLQLDEKSALLVMIQELLLWDSETYMPRGVTESRAEQVAVLEELIHRYSTDERIPELLYELEVNDENPMGNDILPKSIGLFLRAKYSQWKKAVSIPPALLSELAHVSTVAHQAWVDARTQNNFLIFAPYLTKLINLTKNYAMSIGYKENLYDAVIDQYEPGQTTNTLNTLFSTLQKELTPLYLRLCEKYEKKNLAPQIYASVSEQKAFCTHMAGVLGFNFDTGRIDTSIHPFCSTTGWQDVRITTCYKENFPTSAVFSVLHEMGHAWYEHNISPLYKNTVCGTGASFGVHESQSHFIESVIGKNPHFWKYWYPVLQRFMPNFTDVSFSDFMVGLHTVKRNSIRTESDEVGYNLHIILRFEMEKLFFADENPVTESMVRDMAQVWNEKSKEILGIVPKNDVEGILQDVHWSQGSFGYFPSYALGTIYATQLERELKGYMPDYENKLERGTMLPIIEWLKSRIHEHGASLLPTELYPTCDIDTIMRYIINRYEFGE